MILSWTRAAVVKAVRSGSNYIKFEALVKSIMGFPGGTGGDEYARPCSRCKIHGFTPDEFFMLRTPFPFKKQPYQDMY